MFVVPPQEAHQLAGSSLKRRCHCDAITTARCCGNPMLTAGATSAGAARWIATAAVGWNSLHNRRIFPGCHRLAWPTSSLPRWMNVQPLHLHCFMTTTVRAVVGWLVIPLAKFSRTALGLNLVTEALSVGAQGAILGSSSYDPLFM